MCRARGRRPRCRRGVEELPVRSEKLVAGYRAVPSSASARKPSKGATAFDRMSVAGKRWRPRVSPEIACVWATTRSRSRPDGPTARAWSPRRSAAALVVLQVAEDHGTDLATTTPVVGDHEFINCVITGPAVVAPIEQTTISNCSLGGAPDEILWPMPPSQSGRVFGAVGLVNCTFERCHFEGIGFTGSPEFLEQMRSNLVDDP